MCGPATYSAMCEMVDGGELDGPPPRPPAAPRAAPTRTENQTSLSFSVNVSRRQKVERLPSIQRDRGYCESSPVPHNGAQTQPRTEGREVHGVAALHCVCGPVALAARQRG